MMPRSDFWSGLVVAFIGLLALLWMIPNYAGSNPFARMPPGLVPGIGSWLMLICGGIVAVKGIIQMRRDNLPMVTTQLNWGAIGWAAWPFAYVAVAIWFMLFIKITWFGAFLIAGMLILLGERRWYMNLGFSVVPMALGSILGTVGLDNQTGLPRLTFGYTELMDGMPLIAVAIATLALSEMFVQSEKLRYERGTMSVAMKNAPNDRITWPIFKSILPTILRGTGVGTFVGALPGLGPSVGSFMSYGMTVKACKDPDSFGKSNIP